MTSEHHSAARTVVEAYGLAGPDGRALPRPELQALADLAARLCGARTGAVDVQLEHGWGTLAGPALEEREELAVVAAVPLVSASGVAFGELRVLDLEAPAGGAATRDLAVLAQAVVDRLELDAAGARALDSAEDTARAEARLAQVCRQVSHDLNNPLAAMAMSVEIARDQVDDAGQPLLASLLDRAAGSAARMKRMTADLLAYGQTPGDGATDLRALLEQVTEDLDGVLPLEVRVQGDLPVVAGHPGDLAVVVVGLLENAVKFGPDGADPTVTVAAERVGERWRIAFADNGRGVPADELRRIFEPTVRLDKRVPGLGMGLAAASRVVAAVGGEVGAEPGAEGGTTVWLDLPAR